MNHDQLLDAIDGYLDTIYAIVGFINLYRYDDDSRTMRPDVKVFQGRKLERLAPLTGHVTPDIGVLLPVGSGLLGDVKQAFPQDRNLWYEDFDQLANYDAELDGWPCPGGRCPSHDIVLLAHQTRAVAVRDFLQEAQNNGRIRFERPFVIVEFNRSSQRKESFFFRLAHGNLSEATVNDRLQEGVAVPMQVFVGAYSTIKLYDANPPVPWLMHLIWNEVIARRASDDPGFPRLRSNQKIHITLPVDEITLELQNGFSFKPLHDGHEDRQPQTPRRSWVIAACDVFVGNEAAKWDSDAKQTITFFFRKSEDTLNMCVDWAVTSAAQENEGQEKLFATIDDEDE